MCIILLTFGVRFTRLSLFILVLISGTGFSQTITHGPMTGGVTENSARIYIRTNQATDFTMEYRTDLIVWLISVG